MRFLLPCAQKRDEDGVNSRQIDREIKNWIKTYNDAIKLLLLGTGESGKTTIIKQMKILHVQGFTPRDHAEKVKYIRHNMHESIYDIVRNMSALSIPLSSARNVQIVQDTPAHDRAEKVKYIRHNVHESIYDIVRNMSALSIPLSSARNVQAQQFILKCGLEGPPEYNEQYFDYVRMLWHDAGVKECFKRSNEYQLIDSAEYFLDRIDLLEKPDYVPSDADILRCRQKTTGIQKIEFKVKVPKSMQGGVQDFWMFDVGGQRGERKKWIQVFEGIHAIWFLVACSDFDQTLREDPSQNRLREALVLFQDVWLSRFLLEAGLIVFLNKQDLLEQKIAQGKSIGRYFPDYDRFEAAGDEYSRTKLFIRNMFADITKKQRERKPQSSYSAESFVIQEVSQPRECYFHYTTATDTDNVRTVFKDVHQMILTNILTNIGIY